MKRHNLLIKQDKNSRLVISVAFAFVIAMFSFLRGPAFDHDYQTYAALYAEVIKKGALFFSGSVEPGFYFLMWCFGELGVSIDLVLFYIAFICLAIKLYTALRFGYLVFFVYIPLYVTSFFLIHELNQTRIAISTALFYLMAHNLYYFFEVKRIKFRILYIAPLFQYSSAILFLVLVKNKISSLVLWLAVALCLIYLILNNSNYADLILTYLLSGDERVGGYAYEIINGGGNSLRILSGGNIVYIFYAIMIRLMLVLFIPEKKNNRLIRLNEFFIGLSVVLFVVFINAPVVATRFSELLRIFTPLVMAIIISDLFRKGGIPAVIGGALYVMSIFLNLILYGPAISPINQYLLFPFGLSRVIGGVL